MHFIKSLIILVITLLAQSSHGELGHEDETGSSEPAASGDARLEVTTFTVESGDVILAARAVGGLSSESRTMVLIHGGPDLSHDYMQALEPLASDELRIINYDQRGVGASTAPPPTDHTLEHHLNDLEAIRNALGVERITILAHSWGGLIAMAYAIRHPEQVEALIFVASLPPTTQGVFRAQRSFSARQAQLVREGAIPVEPPMPVGDDCGPQIQALLPVYMADPAFPPTPELVRTRCHISVRAATWPLVIGFDFSEELANLSLPVLIVYGERDPFGVPMAEEVREAFTSTTPDWSLLPACGHLPFIECPELFFAALEPFLAQLDQDLAN